MYVKIGNTDVTSAVQETTYKVDREKQYDSWVNANNVERHRNIRYKIVGSFDMVFIPGYSMSYADFKALVDANTVGDVTTITLSVNNLDGANATIQCFLDITFDPIIDLKNGSNLLYKRCRVSIQEC